jgi:exosortase/archaeosortase family protein
MNLRRILMRILDSLKKIKKPIIEYEGKKYVFSLRSILLFATGAPISAYFIFLFFDLPKNFWLHEIVVKQTVYLLNLFFNMGAQAVYVSGARYPWEFTIPGKDPIGFETFCTGIQAICVFAGIILFTPHSQDPKTTEDIVWRKTKALIVSSVIFYVVNIIRMLIQIELYNIGYAWKDIHFSISAASSFIAAIIVLLLHKWIPEFIISIIYVGTYISEPIKAKRREKLKQIAEKNEKVELEMIRKALGFNKKTFLSKFSELAQKYDLEIEGEYLLIPREKYSSFLDGLENKFEVK